MTGDKNSLALVVSFLNATEDGFWAIDPSGAIVAVNPAYCRLSGYTESELLRQHVHDIVTEDSALIVQHLQNVSNLGADTCEVRHRCSNNTLMDVEMSTTRVSEGQWHAVSIIRDVRPRKERDLQLAKLFEHAADAIFLSDAEGRIVQVNQQACRSLGYSREELLALTILDIDSGLVSVEDQKTIFEQVLPHQSFLLKSRHKRKDGTTFPVEIRITKLLMPNDNLVLGIARDISEREESENRFLTILENIPGGVFVHDVDGKFLLVNGAACRNTGYSREELLSMSVSDIDQESVSREDRLRLWSTLREGEVTRMDAIHMRKDGTIYPADIYLSAFTLDGQPVILPIAYDVTQRKEAETALHTALMHQQAAVQAGNVGLWDWDLTANRVKYSKEWKSQIGHAESEIGDSLDEWVSRVHPDDLAPALEKSRNSIQQGGDGYELEFRFRHKNGSYRWILAQASILRDKNGMPIRALGAHVDITENKRVVEELRRSEEQYRLLADNMLDMMFSMNTDLVFTYVNPACKIVTGYDPEEWMGTSFEDRCTPGQGDAVHALLRDKLEANGNNTRMVFETCILNREQAPVFIEVFAQTVYATSGQPESIQGIIRDISERKRAEEERERLISAIEQAGEIIFITDDAGVILYVNPAFEKTTGFPRDVVLGATPRFLKSGRQDTAFYKHLWETIQAGETWKGRMVNQRPDGFLFTVDATISPVRNRDGKIVNYVAVQNDITAQLTLEEQYRQSQKMEAIGQLTGGVAHDFNNLLQVINAGTELALDDLEPGHPARDSMLDVADAGERAARLVEQLLLFSRRQIMRPAIVELNVLVGDLLKMLGRLIGEHIRLDWLPGAQLGVVYADRNMLEQALTNLCVNARDAMLNGGILTIETENVKIDSEYCKIHNWAKPGRYVLLSVTDTGCGMSRETLSHVFEPFYTTKETGKGTGLGLATVYGIVKQHEGMISAYSEPDQGSTFKVYLPICERNASEVGTKIEGMPLGGNETILLAEDEEMVCTLARTILERAGYTVLTAPNGIEAVELFSENKDKIALAILDVVMPVMGGKQAYQQMHQQNPDLKVLFASGYSENVVHTNFVLDEGLVLIQKPYARNELLKTVRSLLDAPAKESRV